MLSGKVFCLKSRTDLLTGISGVPLIHDIAEWRELVIALHGIHVVIQGDQAGTALAEHFHICADLQIVSSEAGHILDNAGRDVSGSDLIDHGLKAWAVETGSGDPVIGKMPEDTHTVRSRVILEDPLLVGDGVGFSLLFVIVAEPLIERHISVFILFRHVFSSFRQILDIRKEDSFSLSST
jgi:hypothetical protein